MSDMIQFENTSDIVKIEKPTVKSMLSGFSSAIALDIAPLHTGVVIWNGIDFEEYYFMTPATSKDDCFRLYRMRRAFKTELEKIVKGKSFDFCFVEDIYGGENYDTSVQLITLNTVMDELLFDRVCTAKEFFRWKPSEWLAKARRLYKQKNKLKTKIEIQGILEYLECDYFLRNNDLSKKQKEDCCFEDICDAYGMLLAVASHKKMEIDIAKASGLRFSDIKMFYLEDLSDIYYLRDKRIKEEAYLDVELNTRSLENSILNLVQQNPSDVLCAVLPVEKLGAFGLKHNFEYFASGEGYLLFYNKRYKV